MGGRSGVWNAGLRMLLTLVLLFKELIFQYLVAVVVSKVFLPLLVYFPILLKRNSSSFTHLDRSFQTLHEL